MVLVDLTGNTYISSDVSFPKKFLLAFGGIVVIIYDIMMKKFLILFLCFVSCVAWGDNKFSTKAKSALLIDFDSGDVVFAKNADDLMPPSSMLKLMTLTVLFDAIKSGDLKLTDTLPVSKNADYKNKLWQNVPDGGAKHYCE